MGKQLNCRGWQQEGLLRLLLNCIDPDVASNPKELIVYGGSGKAAKDWQSLHATIETLKDLKHDETLLIASGKPVGVFRTFPGAPRVITSWAMLVPKWAQWETFRELEAKGLTSYGQSTAGAWAFIGTQGILQGTYETFAQVARQYFRSDLRGKLVLTSGLGSMGGAQPLAVTMNGGVTIVIDVDRATIKRSLENSYCDVMARNLNEALDLARESIEREWPLSIALQGNAAQVYPKLLAKGVIPDIVTDQTPAHDLLSGYIPEGLSVEQAQRKRKTEPGKYQELSLKSIQRHVAAMLEFKAQGSIVFDYGNNIREQGTKAGVSNAFDIQGFVPAALRDLFCEGRGPFRWVALSGDPTDIFKTDEVVLREFAHQERLTNWILKVQKHVNFQGLPARVCWLNYKERAHFGKIINEMVRTGELAAPIAITRDHLDSGSVASPNRETEAMPDGSDAIADWPVLNALLNCSSGATMAGLYHGGGVGIGYSIHSGMTVIADGTDTAADKLDRVLTNDPGLGVVRHADAGCEKARKEASQFYPRVTLDEGE